MTILKKTIFLFVVMLVVSACTKEDSLSQQINQTQQNKNYVSTDGTVTTLLAENRKKPVDLQVYTYAGEEINSQQLVNQVTVINFWYAACGPCRAEAADLESLSQEFSENKVSFLGVNIRDQAETAAAFQRTFGVTYPMVDGTDGKILAQMKDQIPQQAVPTTVVLDKTGRLAAKILGVVDPKVLRPIITNILVEQQ